MQQLAGVIPLVHGLGDVEPLVALEPDQLAAGPRAEDLGHLRLADPRVTLEQQGPLHAQGQEDRRRQPLVGQVPVRSECRLHLVDRPHPRHRPNAIAGPSPHRSRAVS